MKIQGNTDWQDNPELQKMQAMAGQKLGEWKTDGYGMYIDTPWGRVYDNLSTQTNRDQGGDKPYTGPEFGGQANVAEYQNQHGSDKVYLQIDKDGVLQEVGTNRESPRDRNAFLLAAAALATGGLAYGAAGAAGAGGTGAAGAGAAGTGAIATPVATGGAITATPLASAPALAGSGGVVSGGLVSGGATIAGPTMAAGTAAAGAAGLANSAGDAASAANTANNANGGGAEGEGGWWDKVFTDRVIGQGLAGIGSGLGAYLSAENAEKLLDKKINADAAENERARQWKARNFGPDSQPKITWNS